MDKQAVLNITDEVEFTDNPFDAIYILEDGTMVSGKYVDGFRTEDHRVMELVSVFDRYSGEDFWLDLLEVKGMLLVEPETEIIYNRNGFNEKQGTIVSELLSNGYELRHFV